MPCDLGRILLPKRKKVSTIKRGDAIDEFYSDRSRILYSSSFRRLQQKAQVFSLEPNCNVRSRLTHSIEVSDIGRTLSRQICTKLDIPRDVSEQVTAIVENACLMHDIGNPPFGHFGERAIQEWSYKIFDYADAAGAQDAEVMQRDAAQAAFHDLEKFDGNPQGLRVVTRLHCERDQYGLNLTYPTILASIKYPCSSMDSDSKKCGYFLSEKELVSSIYNEMNVNIGRRYVLSYIMEAADDIAYCMSDISDGIEKNIISISRFVEELRKIWRKEYGGQFPIELDERSETFSQISVPISRYLIGAAAEKFEKNLDCFIDGSAKKVFDDNIAENILEAIKSVSRNIIYRSFEAENIELSGYSIITGLLNHFWKLLKLNYDNFNKLINGSSKIDGLELELRIFNRLSKRLIKSYEYQLREKDNMMLNDKGYEWFLRAHLIIDQISGMTDDYALQTFRMFEGMITK